MLNFVFFYKKSIKKFCSVKSICIFVKEITTKKIEIMTTELKELNAIKSINTFEYFGNYKNVEWMLVGEKWNKKVWWYLIENGVKNDMPTNNLKDAAFYMKKNIDYNN